MDESASASTEQFLAFELGGDCYALAIQRVREIVEYTPPTRVPGTPPFVRGVMNLRGSVVPVIDLARKLGLDSPPVTRRTCSVILEIDNEGERLVMGLVVDSVSDVLELTAAEIAPPPPFGTRVKLDYLRGLTKRGGGFTLVIDIDRVLSAEELAITAALDPSKASAPAAADKAVSE
jgi:purine-binding chemotaxis protein CheW